MVYYDKDRKQVTAPGYFIAMVGKAVHDDIRAKFFYQDDEVSFYFAATRQKWVQLPSATATGRSIDTEIYDICRMWCRDSSCVYRKDLSEEAKRRARHNIPSGMMFMEEDLHKPPKQVLIGRE